MVKQESKTPPMSFELGDDALAAFNENKRGGAKQAKPAVRLNDARDSLTRNVVKWCKLGTGNGDDIAKEAAKIRADLAKAARQLTAEIVAAGKHTETTVVRIEAKVRELPEHGWCIGFRASLADPAATSETHAA